MTTPQLTAVSYAAVQFGPYLDTNKKPRFVGMRGWARISTRVTHKVTGETLVETAVPFVIGADGTAVVRLPHTDQAALNEQNFTYTVRWQSGYGTAPASRTFSLPRAVGSTVKYDTMVPSSVAPGVYIPLEPSSVPPVNPSTPTSGSQAPSHSGHHHHFQTVPAATWLIDHELNIACPNVVLVIEGKLVYSDVYYSSASRVTIQWPTPTVGEAHLSF